MTIRVKKKCTNNLLRKYGPEIVYINTLYKSENIKIILKHAGAYPLHIYSNNKYKYLTSK